jgi:aminoethylphosphonate catabolism LysR family transcriptional regulator
MQYAQLRAFHAVVEYSGFSKAANALGLTQPSVSDHVRRLEQTYGVTLFVRNGRLVEPTELGRRLSLVTQQMLNCERDAHDLLSSARSLTSGTLTIVADAPDLAVKLITKLRARYPGVLVKLSIANAQACVEQVLASAVDAAVTAAPQADSRLMSTILRREPLVAILPAGHALAQRGELDFAEFVSQPLIFREQRSVTQQLLTYQLLRHGLSAEPVMLVEGREALEQSVANGLGIGIIARAEFSGSRHLRCVPLAGCEALMVESLVRLAERPPSRLLDALFGLADAYVLTSDTSSQSPTALSSNTLVASL